MTSLRLQRLSSFNIADRFATRLPRLVVEFSFGLFCLSLAVGTRSLVDRVAPIAGPYTLLFPVILIATLFGRWRAGLTAYVIGFAWAWFMILPHTLGHRVSRETDFSRLAINAGSAVVILIFAEVFRRAVHASNIARDIALADARDREAQMRLALDAGRLGSWTLDVANEMLTMSEACRALFGRGPDERFSGEGGDVQQPCGG